jgi:hypothetical protein
MSRLSLVATLTAILVMAIPTAALADPVRGDGGGYTVQSHSGAGGVAAGECGFLERHTEEIYTKGTADALVYRAEVHNGCQRLVLSGLAAAGIGEAQGNEEQQARCLRNGRDDAVNAMRYYFDTEIDPESVRVGCYPYKRRS